MDQEYFQAREPRRKELTAMSKAALIEMCRSGVPNPRGGRTHVYGAHPLEKWRKDEIVSTILDIEFPPPGLVELPLEGLS